MRKGSLLHNNGGCDGNCASSRKESQRYLKFVQSYVTISQAQAVLSKQVFPYQSQRSESKRGAWRSAMCHRMSTQEGAQIRGTPFAHNTDLRFFYNADETFFIAFEDNAGADRFAIIV